MIFSKHIQTPAGTVRIRADEEGLLEILLPGSDSASGNNENDERKNVPSFLESAAEQILEYFEGRRTVFDLPLSPAGTQFQLEVWKIIRSIPYGHTMSYGEIAGKLGNRNKARGVGGAAHANPLPLVIPCHRVIGSNGSLTGFGGGIQLKRYLLELEQRFAEDR